MKTVKHKMTFKLAEKLKGGKEPKKALQIIARKGSINKK